MAFDFACTSPADWVKNALDERAKAISNPGEVSWANRTGPWARVLSSALIDNSSEFRRQYMLTSNDKGDFKDSYRFVDNEVGGLVNTFRPVYGLESISVSYKGTMGSTKSCKVQFKVWTLEDLEIMEKLYMVPGISVIVEWGWPLDLDGTPITAAEEFVELGQTENPYPNIMKTIIDRRIKYHGNYDGLVGLITNFNYSLNDKLGFDCDFELVSPGEMWLEQNTSNVSRNCIGINDKAEIKKMSNLESVFNEYYTKWRTPKSLETLAKVHKSLFPETDAAIAISQWWETSAREYDKNHNNIPTEEGKRNRFESYISWNLFIKILNENINQYILDVNGGPTDSSKKNPDVSIAMDLIPVTVLPKMCPLDPNICTFFPYNIDYQKGIDRFTLLNSTSKDKETPAEVTARKASIKDRQQNRSFYTGKRSICTLFSMVEFRNQIKSMGTELDRKNVDIAYGEVQKSMKSGGAGLLNGIYINTGFLRDISEIISGDKVTADDYLKKILDSINVATGNLWNLQYKVDEENPHLLHIYDANYASDEARTGTVQPYEFKLLATDKNGDPNIMIRTMNVQSKLVDGFKSMVLYGNNSDNGNFDTAHHAMSLYAEKITDGWKIGPGQNQSQGHDNTCRDENGNIVQATLEEDPEADLDMAYGDLLDSVTDGSIANVKNAMQSYIAFLNSKKPKTAATLPMNQNILLPFNFSVVIDGFSGFNWGNTIKVDYLPSRYFNKEKNSRIYFQITKVNHEITLNDWATTVETIMRLTPEWADVSTPSTNNQGVPMASAGTTTTTTTNQGPLRQVVDTSSTTGGTNFTPWRP